MADNSRLPDPRRTEEFLELYSPCQHSLYVYIVTLIGNPTDAHNVLQDVNLVLWEKFDQFQPGTNFRAWAREVARYRVLRYRQMRANDAPMLDSRVLEAVAAQFDSTEPIQDELYTELLVGCVEQLSNADRELIRAALPQRRAGQGPGRAAAPLGKRRFAIAGPHPAAAAEVR